MALPLARVNLAKQLRESGYTLREISRYMGITEVTAGQYVNAKPGE